MVGILLVTHGEMAPGIINALSLIMGEQTDYKTLGLFHGDDISQFKDKIQEAIIDLDTGEGVLVLVDLFSASPYNQTAMLFNDLQNHKLRLVSGVNLPMVIEAFNQRLIGSDLDTIYRSAMLTATEGVKEFLEEFEKVKNKIGEK